MVLIPMAFPSGPPTALQLKLKPTITAIVAAQAVVAVCRFVVGDIWGSLSDAMVVLLGYFVITEHLIMYNMWYGLACGFNFIFDLIHLIVRLQTHKLDFFNLSDKSFLHNLASFTITAATITALLGAAVNYFIFRDFRRSARPESMPLLGSPGAFMQPPPLAPGRPGRPNALVSQNRPDGVPTDFAAFSGSGYRLGGEDDAFAAVPQLGAGGGRPAGGMPPPGSGADTPPDMLDPFGPGPPQQAVGGRPLGGPRSE